MQVFFDLFFPLFCEFKTYQKKFISTISAWLGTTDLVCPILHERRGLLWPHPSHTSSIGTKQQRGSTTHTPGTLTSQKPPTHWSLANTASVTQQHQGMMGLLPADCGQLALNPQLFRALFPRSTWHRAQHVQLVIKDGHSALASSHQASLLPTGSGLTQGPPQVHTVF